jgi:hypothetical protein
MFFCRVRVSSSVYVITASARILSDDSKIIAKIERYKIQIRKIADDQLLDRWLSFPPPLLRCRSTATVLPSPNGKPAAAGRAADRGAGSGGGAGDPVGGRRGHDRVLPRGPQPWRGLGGAQRVGGPAGRARARLEHRPQAPLPGPLLQPPGRARRAGARAARGAAGAEALLQPPHGRGAFASIGVSSLCSCSCSCSCRNKAIHPSIHPSIHPTIYILLLSLSPSCSRPSHKF